MIKNNKKIPTDLNNNVLFNCMCHLKVFVSYMCTGNNIIRCILLTYTFILMVSRYSCYIYMYVQCKYIEHIYVYIYIYIYIYINTRKTKFISINQGINDAIKKA